MAKKKKQQGHYCKICGERKANEKFSGKGHAKHICKECSALPQEKKNELQHINQIDRIAGKYPRSRQDWEFLEKMSKNRKYPEAAEFAQSILEMNRNQSEIEPDNEYIFDNNEKPNLDNQDHHSDKKFRTIFSDEQKTESEYEKKYKKMIFNKRRNKNKYNINIYSDPLNPYLTNWTRSFLKIIFLS